jgi:uncharacterized protein YegJ (DUF2314 family)
MVGQLSEATTMKARLTVTAKLDKSRFPINVEVAAEEIASYIWLADPFESACFSAGVVAALICSSASLIEA